MEENNNLNFVIKQSLFEPLTNSLLTPLFPGLIYLIFFKDIILSLSRTNFTLSKSIGTKFCQCQPLIFYVT